MLDETSLKLKERTLYYDGDSVVYDLNFLYNKILKDEDLDNIFVEEISPEVKKYNSLSGTKAPLSLKTDYRQPRTTWTLPEEYASLNLKRYALERLENEIKSNDYTDDEINERVARVQLELTMWEEHDMNSLLSTLIYLVNTLEDEGMVWGTGRGSSCCSYVLYLIGLHDVDSVCYNLDIKEFFKN